MSIKGWWILKILSNIWIAECIPLLFGKLVEDISLSVIGDHDKSSVVPLMKDNNLVYICYE